MYMYLMKKFFKTCSVAVLLAGMVTGARADWVDPPYPTLPKVLEMENGEPVTTTTKWENERRQELLNLFCENEYGFMPDPGTYTSTFSVTGTDDTAADGTATRKTVHFTITGPNGTHEFNAYIYVPKAATKPTPAILFLDFSNFTGLNSSSDYFPLNNLIIPRGYSLAFLYYQNLAADNNSTWRNGIINIFNLTGSNSWKAIGAWSFGASRVMDYLQTDTDIDPKRIGMVGHSRLGKTTLWTCARDQRFALANDNSSGCSGSALARRKYGEDIERITQNYPYWFCDNYNDYAGKEETLPIDQHELLALIAPRLVHLGAGLYEDWADWRGIFYSLAYCQPVFDLYGLLDENEAFGCTPPSTRTWAEWELPQVETMQTNGNLAYHLRNGAHELTTWDWEQYLDFADAKMTGSTRSAPPEKRGTWPVALLLGTVLLTGLFKRIADKRRNRS